jgi:hypothetical protein
MQPVTQHQIPEDLNPQQHHRENLKSRIFRLHLYMFNFITFLLNIFTATVQIMD